jgi:flagellar motor switch protein FliN/FliY
MEETNKTALNDQDNSPQEEEVQEEVQEEEQSGIDFILDIPLDVSVELGRVKMLVNDLLQLGQGSIVELNKAVGDSLEIYISDKLIARGEVVVMDEQFGIRVTDIISPHERVKSLG